MKKINIIKENKDFENIIHKGRIIKNKYYILYCLKNDNNQYYRFGISVGKKVSNKAVIRNRLKRQLKSIIDKYSLSDRFYYLDVTNIMEEDNYLERINNAFDTDVITQVPIILYYQNGKLAADGVVLRDDKNPINAGDFQKLLDIYGYED